MIRYLKVVFCMFCVFSLVGEVITLKCWICSSEFDLECADPFSNRTIPLTECNEGKDGVSQTMCLKMTEQSGNSKIIYRGCAPSSSKSGIYSPNREECLTYKEGNKLVEKCTCNSRLACNSSGNISSTLWMVIISVVCGFCKFSN